MIVLLCGEDRFARMEALAALRAQHDRDGSLATNLVTLEGSGLTLPALRAAAYTVPFLADYRMVRAEGLCGRFNYDERRPRRRALGEWEDLPGVLAGVPETTILVFVDENVDKSNPIKRVIEEGGGAVREFERMKAAAARTWLRKKIREVDLHLTPRAEAVLAERAGGDTGALTGAVEKIRLYAGEATVDEHVVALLVPVVREANIFQLVDAVAEQRVERAMRALDVLRTDGMDERRIIAMLARQYRMIVVAREVLDARGGPREIQEALRVQPFVARRAAEQARRYTQAQADAALVRVVEAEESIQDYWQGRPGGTPQDLAVELLIADLAGSGRSVRRATAG